MKKALLLTLMAASMLASCSDKKSSSATDGDAPQQEESKAAQATWDKFLIGSWKYIQQHAESKPKYAIGVEHFGGDGGYSNHTQDADGEKVVLRGTWKLDDKEDYTLHVNITSKQTAGDAEPTEIDETLTYTVLTLDPGKRLNYLAGKHARRGQWLEQE